MLHKPSHDRRWQHRQQQHDLCARPHPGKITDNIANRIANRISGRISGRRLRSRPAGRHDDKRGLAPRQIDDRRRGAGLMENDVGIANRLDAAQAEQPGIAATDINNLHLCRFTLAGSRDQSGKLPVGGNFIAADNVIRCRTIDNAVLDGAPPRRRQSPQISPPTIKIAGKPAEAGRQHALDTGPNALAKDGRRAGGGNGDEDRRTVDYRAKIGAAERGIVGNIDRHASFLRRRRQRGVERGVTGVEDDQRPSSDQIMCLPAGHVFKHPYAIITAKARGRP